MRNKHRHLQRTVAFFAPIILFSMTMLLCKIHPFGDHTLLIWDAEGQYFPFIAFFRRVLLGQADALYSLSKGFGGSTAGLIAYYLASPLNLLLVFFPENRLIDAIQVLILIRIGLSGFTCYFALEKRKENGWGTLLFSTAYALCGYVACYFWNIMWMDAIVLLPLIAEGIRKIIHGEKPFLYLLSLATALISCYYTGYMLCLFSVLWFLYCIAVESKGQQALSKPILTFVISSILSGALAAIILVPAFFTLGLTSAQESLFSSLTIEPQFPMAQLLSKFLTGAVDYEQFRNGLPNIYVGMPILALSISFFFNQTISRKQRICSALLLGVFLLSFQVKGLYLMWHGFDRPNAMPARFSFLFSFVLIVLAYDAYTQWIQADSKQKTNCFGFLVVAFLFVICFLFSSGIPAYLAYETILLDVALFALACWLIVRLIEGKRSTALLLLFAVEAVGLIANSYFSIHRMDALNGLSYSEQYMLSKERNQLLHTIYEEDSDAFRIENDSSLSENDPLRFGYAGLSHYSSDFQPETAAFADSLGIYQIHYRIAHAAGTTPVLESLFNVKYLLLKEHNVLGATPLLYHKIADSLSLELYRNPYSLSFSYIAPAEETMLLDSDDPFENQNRLIADLTGVDDPIFSIVPITFSPDNNFVLGKFVVPQNEQAYLYTKTSWYAFDDGPFESAQHGLNGCIALPLEEETKTHQLQLYPFEGIDVQTNTHIALLDFSAFERACARLEERSCEVSVISDSHLIIQKTASESEGQLVLTIPYDCGWHIWVDGQKVIPEKRYGALLSIPVSKDDQLIELRFIPFGLEFGTIISVCSALIVTLWMFAAYRKRKEKAA